MLGDDQLEFLAAARRPAWVEDLQQRVRDWAAQGVYFGTSSWKYEGWLGQVYLRSRYDHDGRFVKTRFERQCLAEYGEVFPTVCGDFSFYQFYGRLFWDRLFAQVPSHFQFGFKAPETITCPRFPEHPRYGVRGGQLNADFLNADLCQREFLDRLRPHRTQTGYVVFEFPQFHDAFVTSNRTFLEQLDEFLGRLPAGEFRYGVEIRTRELWNDDYRACLRRHRVGHVFNSWTRMPTIGEQLDDVTKFSSDTVIARLLLKPGRAYDQAVTAFAPYQEVRDPYPAGYRDAARLVRAAKQRQPSSRVYLAVNNRFVGNAPKAIAAILNELAAT